MRNLILTFSLLLSVPSFAQNWQSLDGPYGEIVTGISTSDGQTVFVSSLNGGIFLRGQESGWKNPVPADTKSDWTFVEAVGGQIILAGRPGLTIRSTDNGLSWHTSMPNQDEVAGMYPALTRFRDTLFMLQDDGNDVNYNAGYVSGDHGASWSRRMGSDPASAIVTDSTGRMLTIGYFRFWSSDDHYSSLEEINIPGEQLFNTGGTDSLGRFWLATSLNDGIYRSFDRKSWQKLTSSIPDTIWTVAITPRGIAFVGSGEGVHTSTDGGETWTEFNEGLPPGFVASYLYVAPDGHLYVGTNGAGIFKTAERVTREYAVIKQLDVRELLTASRPVLRVTNSDLVIDLSAEAEIEFFDLLGRLSDIEYSRESGSIQILRSQISQLTFARITDDGKVSTLVLPASK